MPARDEVVLAVWPHDLTTAIVVRYCCPPNGDAKSAVWREALTDEETGTVDNPYAWRQLNADERRGYARSRWAAIKRRCGRAGVGAVSGRGGMARNRAGKVLESWPLPH